MKSHSPSLQVHDASSLDLVAAKNSFVMWRASADGSTFSYWGRENSLFGEPVLQDGRAWLRTVHDEDRARVKALWVNALRTGLPFQTIYRQRQPDGSYRWSQDQALPMRDNLGARSEWIGIVSDIHEDVEARKALEGTQDRLRLAMDGAEIGLWEVDFVAATDWLSEPAARILGLAEAGFVSRAVVLDAIHPEHRMRVFNALDAHLKAGTRERFRIEYALRRKDEHGACVWLNNLCVIAYDADGKPLRIYGVLKNVSERRREQQELKRLAYTDLTTDLPNRRAFAEDASELIEAGQPFTMLLIDIDDFRRINNLLGADIGDELLRMLGARLREAMPDGSYLARVGGDEFALLLPGIDDEVAARDAVTTVQNALLYPMTACGRLVTLTVTAGMALGAGADSAAEMMTRASLALQDAKAKAPGGARFFSPALRQKREQETALYDAISAAVANEEFELHYQPQVQLANRALVGVEALIRWRHPERGLLTPAHFITELATSRWAPSVGRWVIEKACADAAALQAAGVPLRTAVNIFPVQFQMPHFERSVSDALSRHGLPASLLEIEITEEVTLGTDEAIVATLKRLRDLGCTVAFDDYGTGFASLSMLKRFPINRLKIDRSFISEVCTRVEDQAIVDAVLALGRTFNLEIIAEGIETIDQERLLKERGCQEGQGYFYGRPMPLSALLEGFGRKRAAVA